MIVTTRARAFAPATWAASLGLLASLHVMADACGHCIEDKVAATYDYAVLTRAAHEGHVVVFADLRGPAAGAGPAGRTFVARAIGETPGIDGGTVRVSLDPPAASFACNPSRHGVKELLALVNARLAKRSVSLSVIEIDRGPRRDPARDAGR